jgi:hypothetical protein
MGHNELRHDKECQNCGHIVELEYCSKCGQQNTETRQSFHHLITHMFEDITHYDGNFWKTIKYLLFRPGKLTCEYLMGHRMRFVSPVKLYIFISFVCFFTMALLAPEPEDAHTKNEKTQEHTDAAIIQHNEKLNDTLYKSRHLSVRNENKEIEDDRGNTYHTVHELDSIQGITPEGEKMDAIQYFFTRAMVKANEGNFTQRDFIITAAHTLPKVLFVYMPIFAFWLWLFHGKRRWFFFDHGIFTLHYFAFLLLLITINMLLGWLLGYISTDLAANVVGILSIVCAFYTFFYFFRSHRKMYCETRTISRLKGFALFFINFICIVFTMSFTLAYIINNIH